MMRDADSTRPILLTLAAVLAVALVGCGGSDTVEISRQSEPRAQAEDDAGPTEPSGDVVAYCAIASEIRGSIEALDEEPAAALDGLDELADVAPEELRDDFEVAIEGLGELEGLDEDDPSSLSKVLETLLAPELLDALGAIDAFTLEQCGFTLDPGPGDEGGGPGADDDLLDDELFGDDETSITLDDIDAVEADHEGASWAEKINGTFISGGTDVQLTADASDFSDEEALELCEVMLAGLSPKNPDVTISVRNGDDEVAASQDGSCALS